MATFDDADASGAKDMTSHIETRLEVTQGHVFWGPLKSRPGTA